MKVVSRLALSVLLLVAGISMSYAEGVTSTGTQPTPPQTESAGCSIAQWFHGDCFWVN